MTTLVSFVRHGRTLWNEQERMQGRCDVPLSAQGRAEVTAWRLPAEVDCTVDWVSSPLGRALETARLLGGREPRCEAALTEMDWGAWEGLTLADLRARFGVEFSRMEDRGLDFRPPGGESPRDVQRRVRRWLVDVATRGESIAAVTHKGVLRAVLAAATGWDMTCKPPVRLRDDALHRFAVDGAGAIAIVACNVSLRAAAIDERPSGHGVAV